MGLLRGLNEMRLYSAWHNNLTIKKLSINGSDDGGDGVLMMMVMMVMVC